MERTGRTRVVVTLKKPSRDAPPLAVPILPRHIWSSVTRQETPSFENEPPVGSGRFRLLESADSDLIRLARNEEHWSGPGPIDTVELRLFESESAVAGALERGEIDLADDLSPATLARLDGIANIGTHAAETASFISLGVNAGAPRGNGSPILRDARVRRAIAHALDRDALRRQALGEYGVTGTTIVPPVSPFHAEPATDALLDHDVEKARRLLDRAGVRDDDGNGVRELRGGAPARLRLYTRSALPETEVLGTAIATALDAIGIPVQPETLTDRELERRIKGGRYDLFIWGWASEPDPDFILSVLSCGEVGGPGLSDTYFCDPAYERLYQQQRTTRSAARRGRLVQELQLRAYREAPYVVLYYRPRLQAYRADRFVPSDDAGAGVLALAADPASSIALEPVPGAPPPEEVPDTGLEAGASDVAETSDSLRDELSEPRAWIVIGVAALLVLLALTLLLRRLRRARVVGATFDESDLETFEIDELEHDPDDLAGH
ncbi:MAG: ABC transporter substrate-binding protein [Gaiellales bacterium]